MITKLHIRLWGIWCWWLARPMHLYVWGIVLGVVIRVCMSWWVCVAQANGHDLATYLFSNYACTAISLRTMGLHELQQHALHMAAYRQSNLREAGYYYLPLSITHTKYEADALLFNPEIKHALIIQFKAKLEGYLDPIDMQRLLLGYGKNTQLLSYSFLDVLAYAHLCEEIVPQLKPLYDYKLIHLPLLAYTFDANIKLDTLQGRLLEKGVQFYHDIMPDSRYEDLKQQYLAQQQLLEQPELYLKEVQLFSEFHEAVIRQFAQGIAECLQAKVLLLPEE